MTIETRLGPVQMHGADTGRPVLFTIAGAFAHPTYLHRLPPMFPELDVWRAHLPGNHCPELAASSVGVFGAAYAEALSARLAGRPAAVLGVSVGALVALAMRARETRCMILVEPPLRTADAWPLRAYPAKAPSGSEAFLWNVLGVAVGAHEPRDYTGLLQGVACPTRALLGEVPLLPERTAEVLPSFVDEPSRALLRAHRLIDVVDCAGAGHNVPKLAGGHFLAAIRWARDQLLSR